MRRIRSQAELNAADPLDSITVAAVGGRVTLPAETTAADLLDVLIEAREGMGCQCIIGPAPRSTYRDSNGIVSQTTPCECWSCEMARKMDAAIAKAKS